MSNDTATPSLEIAKTPWRRPPPPDAWQEFLSWPGSTSLVTLLSAALLFAGLYGVIEPSIGSEGAAGPRWQVLGTLAAYTAALLAGIWAMCRARTGHPDAIASAVVGVVCTVGYGVVIQLIAPEQPALTLTAALAGWLSALGLGVAFRRIAGGVAWGALGSGAGLLLAWTMLWPVVLSAVVVAEAVRMPTAGAHVAGTDHAVMMWWTAGWGALLAAIGGFLWLAGPVAAKADEAEPFLQRPAMRWALTVVMLLASIVALAVQAHIAGLDLARTDVLPHLILLALLTNELIARGRDNPARDGLAVAGPAALAAWFSIAGWGPDLAIQFRGQGWAPDLVALIGTAPGAPLLAAVAAALLAWRRRASGLWWGAGLALIAAILAWDPRQALVAEAGILCAVAAAIAAWRAQRPDLMVAALTMAGGVLPATRMAGSLCNGVVPEPLLALVAGATIVLLAAGWRPVWVTRNWARLAAWLLGAVVAGVALHLLHGRTPAALPGGRVGEAALLAAGLLLIGWCAWRRRDAAVAGATTVAGLVLVWPVLRWVLPQSRAWLAVWGAFALLAGGVWLAVVRARPEKP